MFTLTADLIPAEFGRLWGMFIFVFAMKFDEFTDNEGIRPLCFQSTWDMMWVSTV